MNFVYCFRHLDANGGILRYRVARCEDDTQAFRMVTAEALPLGCATVEIEREERIVWRGNVGELALSLH